MGEASLKQAFISIFQSQALRLKPFLRKTTALRACKNPNLNLNLRVTNLNLVAQAQLQIMSFELC